MSLFGSFLENRYADLEVRSKNGCLTSAEQLTLAVLRGGDVGESAIPALIDAALEEYGHGSYRVPVRVAGDPKRLKIIIETADPKQCERVAAAFADCTRPQVIGIPYGTSFRVYEVTPDGTVEVKPVGDDS